MFKHILVPTDGSEISAKAARKAIRFAGEMGARVTAYRAVGPASHNVYGEGYGSPTKERTGRRAAGDDGIAPLARLAKEAGVAFDSIVDRSAAADEGIVKAARSRKCDAIFMASRGRRGLARIAIGSVAARVIARSNVPVLVYR